MGASKKFLLTLTLIFFCIFLLLFQIDLAIRNNLLSEKNFSNNINKSKANEAISSLIIDSSKKSGIDISSYKGFLAGDISTVLKGIHGYFIGENDKLPVIDLKNIKQVLPTVLASTLQKDIDKNEALSKIDKLISFIKQSLKAEAYYNISRNTTLNNIVIAKEASGLGLNNSIASNLVEKISKMDSEKTTREDILNFVFTQKVKSIIEIDKIKDSLDLNTVSEKLFVGEPSPVTSLKSLIISIKNIPLKTLIVVNLLFIFIIMLTVNNPKKLIKCLAPIFIVSGLIGSILSLVLPNILHNLLFKDTSNTNIEVLNSIESFMSYIFNSLLIGGIILFVLGISAIIAIKFVNSNEIFKNKTRRSILVVIVTLLIPVSITLGVYNLKNKIDNLNASLKVLSNKDKQINLTNVLVDELNAEFLKNMNKK